MHSHNTMLAMPIVLRIVPSAEYANWEAVLAKGGGCKPEGTAP